MSDDVIEDEATEREIRRIRRARLAATDDWCDDCHGYTHMPYCPAYVEPKSNKHKGDVMERREHTCSRNHLPHLKDEYCDDAESQWSYVETKYAAKIDCGEFELRPGWNGTFDANELRRLLQRAVTEHNQHTTLVEQRDLLAAALTAIRDSYWSENEPYAMRVDQLQDIARAALATVEQGEGRE